MSVKLKNIRQDDGRSSFQEKWLQDRNKQNKFNYFLFQFLPFRSFYDWLTAAGGVVLATAAAAPIRSSSFLCVRMMSKLDCRRFCCS